MTDIPTLIDDAELAALIQRNSSPKAVFLDTEFVREKTYSAELCLIQVATDDEVVILDALKLSDLGPFYDWIHALSCPKVFHAARQDLEIFYEHSGKVLENVEDTQIAAAFLGESEQAGYGALIENWLGIQLDKSLARTDWKKRPLKQDELDYAAGDVIHLRDAYQKLIAELEKRGRKEWWREACSELSEESLYERDPRAAYSAVKGSGKLRGVALAALRELAAWREETALKRDKPRRWILSDDHLVALASRRPKDKKALGRLRIPEKNMDRDGQNWIHCIQTAEASDKDTWPLARDKKGPTAMQAALGDVLMGIAKTVATQEKIAPGLIANRSELSSLAVENGRGSRVFQGWRRELVGEKLEQFLDGDTTIAWDDGRLLFRKQG